MSPAEEAAALSDRRVGMVLEAGGRRFRIGAAFGDGWYSAAYHATDLQSGQTVVVKLPWDGTDPGYRAECDELLTIDRAGGMPRCLGVGRLGSDPAIVQEEVPGERLDQVFSSAVRPRPGGKAVRIVLKLLSRLTEIHARGVAHGDVRGKNTLLVGKRSATVRVIDAGWSAPLDPEGMATDTRDAAMVLVQLLSEDGAVREQAWVESPVLLAGLARIPTPMHAVVPVLLQALDADRSQRFADPAALAKALAPFARLPDP